jgi:hypothetical protein
MRNYSRYLFFVALLLAAYYILWGIYLRNLGFYSQEALFYVEKTKIIVSGLGDRLKVMGLTSPILPFYASFIFSAISPAYAPVIASAVSMAILFYMMSTTLIRRTNDMFYIFILLVIFLLHPGIIYAAASGKSIAMVLVFFFLFFFNLLKFYRSNTTFHVSIASLSLVVLIFCDYKFIWLMLFFVPLVLSITIKTLNLGEQESVFRLQQSFNNPSLRRKLINKTFALYIILFLLPLACIVCYQLLNLTHAQDLNYFNESPYATWTVIADKLTFDQVATRPSYQLPETSVLLSLRVLLYCPMIILALFLFRDSTYQVLTLLVPFAFIEFLHIKYDKIYLVHEYYLMFVILALLCILYRAQIMKNQLALKLTVGLLTLFQLYTGFEFLQNSSISEERNFVAVAISRTPDPREEQNQALANFLDHLPADSHILIDDGIAYPVVAYTRDIVHELTLPYQEGVFLSAIEAPDKYDNYVLLATQSNEVTGFTQLNNRYLPVIQKSNSALRLKPVFETDDYVLYKVFTN